MAFNQGPKDLHSKDPTPSSTLRSSTSRSSHIHHEKDLNNSLEEPITAEPRIMEGHISSYNQAGVDVQTPAQCTYGGGGHCRVWRLAQCLQGMGNDSLPMEQRLEKAERLREALTTERFVSICHVCCGNNTLLSYAANLFCSVEVLEFLLTHARFRQEDGCRISDFIEHLGSVMVCVMARSRKFRFGNCLPGDARQSLILLLRAGSQSLFAKQVWYEKGLLPMWLQGIFQTASTLEFASSNTTVQGQPYMEPVIPIPALLDFVECIIELFHDEDSLRRIQDNSFWTGLLQSLWMHARITRGTLTRVADVTLRLLELGASKQIELPAGAKIGIFLACIQGSLDSHESMSPYADDIDGDFITYDGSLRPSLFNVDLALKTRRTNIERLQTKILSYGNFSATEPKADIATSKEEI